MPKINTHLLSFNRGEIGRHALGRIDVEALRLAAQTQLNFVPQTLGPMTFRPGTQFIGATQNNALPKLVPFVFGADDTALLEFTATFLRIWVADTLLTNVAVTTTIQSGDFSSSTGWALSAVTGTGVPGSAPADAAEATISGGQLRLHEVALGTSAQASQQVFVPEGDQNRLRIEVARGPVGFRVASSTTDFNDYIPRTVLGSGTHSLAFTPTGGSFIIIFFALGKVLAVVDSCTIEAAGPVLIPTPYLATDVRNIRHAQSGDIVFLACAGFQQRQVERRDNNSWSLVKYEQTGGPYTEQPAFAKNIFMNPDGLLAGTIGLISDTPYFSDNNARDTLIKVIAPGQDRQESIAALDKPTPPIRITGVTQEDRQFTWTVSGTWVGTLQLQRSIDGPDGGFVNVGAGVTVNGANTVNDTATHANVEAWYRVVFTAYNVSSGGVATITFAYQGGSTSGQGRIIGVTSLTTATIEVLEPFDNTRTNEWSIGDWSTDLGWPSSVEIFDGRLWWGGRDKIWGSISDDFDNFDEDFQGDAGPINRSIGYGPFSRVSWMLGLQRLVVGRDTAVASIRASNLDAPLTPTDFTIKDCSTKGAANLPALKVDTRAVYVDKSERRIYELVYNIETNDYRPRDLTALNADIGEPGFVDCAVQFQPDTRLHFVRADGQVAVLTYEWEQGVQAWWRVKIAGSFTSPQGAVGNAVVDSVAVLPGELEDAVYYVVKRSINGAVTRYIERLARLDECEGGILNKNLDSHIVYSGPAATTITGLSHLEGQTLAVWGNGKDLGTFTVSGGQITGLSEGVMNAVVGLPYVGQFQSAKLAYAAALGTALNQKKRIDHIGLVLTDTHYQGLKYGPDFTTLDPLPLIEEHTETPANTIWSEFDTPMIEFPGEWHADSRLCLHAESPRPCTVVACAIGITTHDKG
jgi:hypothetical protein